MGRIKLVLMGIDIKSIGLAHVHAFKYHVFQMFLPSSSWHQKVQSLLKKSNMTLEQIQDFPGCVNLKQGTNILFS